MIRRQSARKSFPTPSQNKNIKSGNNSTNNSNIEQNIKTYAKKEETKKGFDFENSRPMTSIPRVGDVIGFKILTLSEDGSSQLESSLFKMGTVLNVSEETQMVDILLHDVIKRSK